MFTTIEGVYRKGKVELLEVPGDLREESRVIVTFLEPRPIDLWKRGIGRQQAGELRARLAAFAEDWESPEMSIYDDYDAASANLPAR